MSKFAKGVSIKKGIWKGSEGKFSAGSHEETLPSSWLCNINLQLGLWTSVSSSLN